MSLKPGILAQVFPGADSMGAVGGSPPAAVAFKDGKTIGYVFSTQAVIGSVGFSGKPIDVLVGLRKNGVIAGTFLRAHSEPILVIGVAEESLHRYVTGFAGLDITGRIERRAKNGSARLPDAISGASVSSAVIADGILSAARAVARSRGLISGAPLAGLDRESFVPADWPTLLAEGSIVRRIIERQTIERSFGLHEGAPVRDDIQGTFIDLYAALITPRRIGQNLLGKREFNNLSASMGVDDHAILIAANGLYSFKGTAFVRSGIFDRVQLVQGSKTIPLTRKGYRNIERLRDKKAPAFREIGVFVIPAISEFDPLEPWRLELLVTREMAGGSLISRSFALEYKLPARYRLHPAAGADSGIVAAITARGEKAPLWVRNWRERSGRIAVLIVMLAVLTAGLVFQDALVKNYRFYRAFRLGFLAASLIWLGWYAGAQLSVVNVLTFVHSFMTDFRWEFFLLAPLIFILWSYVAITLLFWGRGVFCGWLCPFGALQELLNEAACKLKIPQIKVPFGLHERLWPIKYIVFIGLFAVSLNSMVLAVKGAEVEPFKTVITLKFVREWPFVTYVVVLLGIGLFIERFFCRYLCPLGAALALPARLRMFDWLKRYPQCGVECHICAERCTVQAIHPIGTINPNECIHCLNCQTLYFDDQTCPPMVRKRKRRERLAQGASAPPAAGEQP